MMTKLSSLKTKLHQKTSSDEECPTGSTFLNGFLQVKLCSLQESPTRSTKNLPVGPSAE